MSFRVRQRLSGHEGPVTEVGWSLDGLLLATASSDGTAKIWDRRSGKNKLTLLGHEGPVTSVAFSSSGEAIATASQDSTVRCWLTETGTQTHRFDGPTTFRYVSWSPVGNLIAAAQTKCVHVWRTAQSSGIGKVLTGHKKLVRTIGWLSEDRLLSGAEDGQMIFWDYEFSHAVTVIPLGSEPIRDFWPTDDRSRYVVAMQNGDLIIVQISPLVRVLDTFHTGSMSIVSGSATRRGKRLVALLNGEGMLSLVDLETRKPVGTLSLGADAGLARSRGKLLQAHPTEPLIAIAIGCDVALFEYGSTLDLRPFG